MNWNDLVVSKDSLNWVTGWPIKECRRIFDHNCLPNKTSLKVIARHVPDFDPVHYQKLFESNWYKYVDNKSWILNDPFRLNKDGTYQFKRTKKLNFILGILPPDQIVEIEEKWKEKQTHLNNQIKI